MRFSILLFFLTISFSIRAQKINKDWFVEAEDGRSTVTVTDGVIDIIAPKGLTLWNTNLMTDDTVIEYEARIVVEDGNEEKWNRLSDLNCFWMASDKTEHDGSVFAKASGRKGVFINQYALQLYYLGYGGNHNTTTRFRRYEGDIRGVTDTRFRPAILREYLDEDNLLKPNHWYKVRLEQKDGHVRYAIDGRVLVDYVDKEPLTKGYFGFRTTLAHAQLRNFSYTCDNPDREAIRLKWLDGKTNVSESPQTFGVPFNEGETWDNTLFTLSTDNGTTLPLQSWNLAKWPDGSVKWKAFSAVVPSGTKAVSLSKNKDLGKKKDKRKKSSTDKNKKNSRTNESITYNTTNNQYIINNGSSTFYVPKEGSNILDSIITDGVKTAGSAWVEANGRRLIVKNVEQEQKGDLRSTIKIDGELFTLRLYIYKGSDEIKLVHTLLVDSCLNHDGMSSLGIRVNVPLRDVDHKRTIAFATDEANRLSRKTFKVKPLIARRPISVDERGNIIDEKSRQIASEIASWDGFRLSQLSPNAFSIRKRATSVSPWIGTIEGHRAPGDVSICDSQTGVSLALTDFWQSYPSTIQIDNARSNEATVSMWLWSPEAEAMSFEHYDTIAHGLNASYEDVQPGLSTAYGIARTSVIYVKPFILSNDSESYSYDKPDLSSTFHEEKQLCLEPSYLHRKRAFGFWSLPSNDSIDITLQRIIDTYDKEIERNGWYGYFNYGDVMHSYDKSRGEWRYDVGGFAWDNTELASNTMLWYNYLRTASPVTWRMAVAMARHTAEVDCYHNGPHAGLGSRHNVSHWGCGAKEARISQACWNRFLYYLTGDERSGDLMKEVVDADQLLYELDPMRLAQPRSEQYPCTAPARLRVGPDWLAYAGNWFTEWERTGNKHYYDKIVAGMKSIASLPHGLFSGPKALGYDPSSGVVSWEGDSCMQNTNHLMTIMGGFEMMNEMMLSIKVKEWDDAWLDHACKYKETAWEISKNKFRIPRLKAYAYWKKGKKEYRDSALNDLLRGNPFSHPDVFFTNDAATWTLDAIFMKEVME